MQDAAHHLAYDLHKFIKASEAYEKPQVLQVLKTARSWTIMSSQLHLFLPGGTAEASYTFKLSY